MYCHYLNSRPVLNPQEETIGMDQLDPVYTPPLVFSVV